MHLFGRWKRTNLADFCPYPPNMKALYSDYRDGKREVRLPGQKAQPKRLVRGKKREFVVGETVKLLENWRSSPFEFEGSARAGLRAAFCLEGASWARADSEAESLVAESLGTMRAERPSWEDGQRRYVDRGDFCVRCGKPMPDEMVSSGRKSRFCSDVCAKAAISDRESSALEMGINARFEARKIIARAVAPKKVCRFCGQQFVPIVTGKRAIEGQEYCSRQCGASARDKRREQNCIVCGTSFLVKESHDQRFCSKSCVKTFVLSREFKHVCACCGSDFSSTSPTSSFCSRRCTVFMSRWRTGDRIPKRISDVLFDYLFIAPVALERAAKAAEDQEAAARVGAQREPAFASHRGKNRGAMFLTAGLFDCLFKEAA